MSVFDIGDYIKLKSGECVHIEHRYEYFFRAINGYMFKGTAMSVGGKVRGSFTFFDGAYKRHLRDEEAMVMKLMGV